MSEEEEEDDDVVNISEVDSAEQFVEMSAGASKDETLRRRAAMKQISDTLSDEPDSAPAMARRLTELVEGDLGFRDSASMA